MLRRFGRKNSTTNLPLDFIANLCRPTTGYAVGNLEINSALTILISPFLRCINHRHARLHLSNRQLPIRAR
ncbi:hypothetical protein M413DRAFT_115750 [Hebeloma cylindrosporum]|uniref:Uncharacterized protein n=1 Tax=Hebeloma cylindrosporum TaxID=76867 RepID=A0A0C3D0X5_HEBCY|nr:hypothetical protein M413DRAFT_115750 [Hebeloma cylindrosporum h7]